MTLCYIKLCIAFTVMVILESGTILIWHVVLVMQNLFVSITIDIRCVIKVLPHYIYGCRYVFQLAVVLQVVVRWQQHATAGWGTPSTPSGVCTRPSLGLPLCQRTALHRLQTLVSLVHHHGGLGQSPGLPLLPVLLCFTEFLVQISWSFVAAYISNALSSPIVFLRS